ncbi:rod shape-determining protein MreD [Kaarinaea lacus]
MRLDTAQRQGGLIIFATFIAALLLTMMPLPDWGETLRPEWVAMVLIYWCIALPNRVGVFIAWFVGLFLDVASGALLGQNAVAMALIAYLAIKLHLRIRLFPLWQQAMSVLVLVALYQMLTLWIKGMIGSTTQGWSYWVHSLTSMLMWPVVFLLLRFLRRYFKVR